MGGAFKRIMVWTGMDCVLMGAPWGCVATDVDDRGPVVEGVFKRGRLWSLTRLGQQRPSPHISGDPGQAGHPHRAEGGRRIADLAVASAAEQRQPEA